MKVLLVNGSPHKSGCTNRALQEIQQQFTKENIDSEIFWIGTAVHGCVGCRVCSTKGKCVFDDVLNEFLEKAKDADGFIFGSPVYYGACSGTIKCLMDRAFFSGGQYLRYKPAAAVVSCRRGGAAEAFAQLTMYFTTSSMPVISSQYWNQVHGSVPEEVEKDEEGLQTMRTLASNMAWILKCIESGKQNGINRPEPEARISTDFIR